MAAAGEFLNTRELNQLNKNNASKSNIVQEFGGSSRIRNKYDGFAADPESIRHAKTTYFLGTSEIREVIGVAEGACSSTA